MNRKDWDYEKYGGRLDPEENIFFGPVTIRELKASMAMAERIQNKRKLKNEEAVKPLAESVDDNSGIIIYSIKILRKCSTKSTVNIQYCFTSVLSYS